MQHFIFVNNQDLIDQLLNTATEEERRTNMMKVTKGNFFKDNGYLVYEPWLMSNSSLKVTFEDKAKQNEYDTGDPNVSYDELCTYQKEFEEKYGTCDGFCMDADVMAYEFAKVQYCIDRAHGLIAG